MACKHHELAAIYAQQMAEMDEPWKLWEWQRSSHRWIQCTDHPQWQENTNYRQIHKTILINGIEVPEPMREKPRDRETYYFIASGICDGANVTYWTDDINDNLRLKRGVCHLSRENCIMHAKAVFSFSEVK